MSLFILATLAAFFIKGLCGFANTLVFQSILSFGVNNASISPVELALGFPGNAILTWQNRKSLDPKVFGPLMALMLAGNIPGALMLSSIDGRIVKIIFGTAIIFIALDMLRGQGKPRKEKKWMTALVTAVKLMPFMLVSLFAGIAVSKKIDDRRIRKLVLLLLVVSGAMLIAQNL